jgi:hypothetical protein
MVATWPKASGLPLRQVAGRAERASATRRVTWAESQFRLLSELEDYAGQRDDAR